MFMSFVVYSQDTLTKPKFRYEFVELKLDTNKIELKLPIMKDLYYIPYVINTKK